MYIMGFVSPFDRENTPHSSAGCAHICGPHGAVARPRRARGDAHRCTVFITAPPHCIAG